jgi:hypothetical protein
MAKASTLLKSKPLRIMLLGFPGSGKTGSLAPLANAGFKLRILDFDGNLDPMLRRLTPQGLDNVDAAYFEDKTRMGAQFQEPIGIPTAFPNALRMMDRWAYKEADGTEVDLGASKDWGLDTVLVLDNITEMGESAMMRATKLSNKTPETVTDRVWKLSIDEQKRFLDKLSSFNNNFHVIAIAHLKMVGPKEHRKGDSETGKAIKDQIAELLPTRFYPNVLGWQYPQVAAKDWPIVIEAATHIVGRRTSRSLNMVPRAELDLKYPGVESLDDKLDISDGLLKVFKALSPASFELLASEKSE